MSYKHFVHLVDPPAPISSEPIVIDNGKSHLSLSWGKPLNTNNAAPVIAYRVEAWLIGAEGNPLIFFTDTNLDWNRYHK